LQIIYTNHFIILHLSCIVGKWKVEKNGQESFFIYFFEENGYIYSHRSITIHYHLIAVYGQIYDIGVRRALGITLYTLLVVTYNDYIDYYKSNIISDYHHRI